VCYTVISTVLSSIVHQQKTDPPLFSVGEKEKSSGDNQIRYHHSTWCDWRDFFAAKDIRQSCSHSMLRSPPCPHPLRFAPLQRKFARFPRVPCRLAAKRRTASFCERSVKSLLIITYQKRVHKSIPRHRKNAQKYTRRSAVGLGQFDLFVIYSKELPGVVICMFK
jgi:hypothetical protein